MAKCSHAVYEGDVFQMCFCLRFQLLFCLLKGLFVCFLVVLVQIRDAKGLFLRLEEKGLLENDFFLSRLLQTIRRADLLNLLETDSRQPEETDANPVLSDYR